MMKSGESRNEFSGFPPEPGSVRWPTSLGDDGFANRKAGVPLALAPSEGERGFRVGTGRVNVSKDADYYLSREAPPWY